MSDPSTWRDEKYLLDMLLAARRVCRYVEPISWEQFQIDELIQDAVIRPLQIIGEAARRISDRTKAAHPQIPWASIIGMRHRLVHDYVDVDLSIVWHASTVEVPRLIELLEPLVPGDQR